MTPKVITLTNASKLHKGKKLLINPNHIMSVFEAELDGETVTMLYSHTRETWEVEESLEIIDQLINRLK